ncbi:hypothetical protein [Ferrovibrio sp.]|uniref:hypothetical protein n=1 Tax=Ferrovibrio sp. TaxID=1917215 RepID=UPI000CA9EF13|nr:hypothetical protein [Ferrovibrio sp.]PJI37709.1 MAG: hypothetical protein CTR53_18925 [Ferrovibrio sp.]
MRRGAPVFALIILAAGLAGCDGMRDLNRSLYRGLGGETRSRPIEGGVTSSSAGTPCFSAETGLLYTSQTGRCAPGYAPIGNTEAQRQFQTATQRGPVAGRGAPEIAPLPQQNPQQAARPGIGSIPQSNVPPSSPGGVPSAPYAVNDARVGEGVFALCYNDSAGHVFEAQSCPPGSRWINTEEAELLQRAQLAEASWCFFPGRSVLYRSRACRPGDRQLNVAEADRVWETLPADRRTRNRPSATGGGAGAPIPAVDAAPRGGVNATPLPPSR